ncbi:hypothetical protein ACEWY4_022002 [Coilia grayii]|uniref:Galectin n=1 Tax=Coilia grayii TaxID=363190 RepID=A0ABD1J507_9TELE
MAPKDALQVSGIIPHNAKLIQVALGSDWYNLSMFMEVRFEEEVVVANTRKDGRWGKEIQEANPYKLGGKFEVTVDFTGPKFIITMGTDGSNNIQLPNCQKTRRTEKIFVRHDLQLTLFSVTPGDKKAQG